MILGKVILAMVAILIAGWLVGILLRQRGD